MESGRMVVDTSIFIEYLRTKDKTKTTLFKIPNQYQIYISAVTLYELLMGATSNEKYQDIRILTYDLPVLPFDDDVAVKASEIYHYLRKNNQMIEFRDIFIAATSIENAMPIVTLNKKHFDRIQQLKIVEI